jgi:metal-sulfur cluster biosynthetic enzyme
MWNAFVETLMGEPPEQAADGEPPFELTEETVPLLPEEDAEPYLEALREVIDPELGVNILDLGLVYGLDITGETIEAAVTATTPACPMSGMIVEDVDRALAGADRRDRPVEVYLVWEPAWSPERMTDRGHARLDGADLDAARRDRE